jgi:hypothetical protein
MFYLAEASVMKFQLQILRSMCVSLLLQGARMAQSV